MAEEKFASLSSGLLARKGAAKPAMRRQGFMNPNGSTHDDLGWNDMGYEAPRPIHGEEDIEAPMPQVRQQLDRLARDMDETPSEKDVYDSAFAEDEEDDREEFRANGSNCGLSPVDTPSEVEAGDPVETEAFETEIDEDHSIETAFEPAPIEEQMAAMKKPSRPEPELSVQPEQSETEAVAEQDVVAQAEADRVVRTVAKSVPARQKAAFTLRLDRERHLKLRLASALHNRSAQQIVTEALDNFLADMPELDALAARASNDTTH